MLASLRKILTLTLLALGCLGMGAPDATAQRWLQTSQLLSEITQDAPTRAFLDTLVQVMDRESVTVKRTADANQARSIADLRTELINEKGIGLTSANWVFINYQFQIQNRGFEEEIQSFQFVYRPPGGTKEDIQMLYVDASKPWVQNVLQNKGTPLARNEAGTALFVNQLTFARLQKRGKIVEISGKTVREGFEQKKRKLVQKIQRLTYESM